MDFFIPNVNIAIELDGSQHYEPEAREADKKRDAELLSVGIKVIRYTNVQINRNFDGVMSDIMKTIGLKYEDLKPRK